MCVYDTDNYQFVIRHFAYFFLKKKTLCLRVTKIVLKKRVK